MKMFVVLPGTILESDHQLSHSLSAGFKLTLRVDDWGHGQDLILRVVNDRVSRRISNQV